MNWNGSGGRSKASGATSLKTAARFPVVRGIVAGIIVVALAVVFHFAFFSSTKEPQRGNVTKTRGQISEVKPSKPAKAAPVDDQHVSSKRSDPLHDVATSSSMADDVSAEVVSTGVVAVSNDGKDVEARLKRPLKSHMEQLISMAVPATEGGVVPPLPVLVGEEADKVENVKAELADIEKGFANELKEEETDSDKMLERKELVHMGKEEFKQLMKEGYTLRQYVEALRDRYNADAEFLSEAQKIMGETIDDVNVSDEDCRAMKAKIDKLLQERGMRPLGPDYDLDSDDNENDTSENETSEGEIK